MVFGLSHLPLFKINEVRCQLSNFQECPPELENKLQTMQNKSLFVTQNNQHTFQTLTNINNYQLISTQIHLPNRITFTFHPINYVYEMSSAKSNGSVSDQGYISKAEHIPNNLPKVIIDSTSNTSLIFDQIEPNKIDHTFHSMIVDLITNLKTIGEIPQEIHYFSRHNLQIKLENNITIILDTDQILSNFRRLQLIKSNKKIIDELKPSNELDLRFTLPILRNIN